jgi:hypothetical protein
MDDDDDDRMVDDNVVDDRHSSPGPAEELDIEEWFETHEEEWFEVLEVEMRDMNEEWFETGEEEWLEAFEEQARVMEQTAIPIDDMIENIVSSRTRRIYYDDMLHFIQWCIINKPTWVTTFCKEQIHSINDSVHGM